MTTIMQHRKQSLLEMGFTSYRQYLDSDLWKGIRERVLKRDRGCCRRCGGHATQVHHTHYWREVLEGRDDSYLVAICRGCHKAIEFKHGEKRPMSQVVNRDFGFHVSRAILTAPATQNQKDHLALLYSRDSGVAFDVASLDGLTYGRYNVLAASMQSQLAKSGRLQRCKPKLTREERKARSKQKGHEAAALRAVLPITDNQRLRLREMQDKCGLKMDDMSVDRMTQGEWHTLINSLYAMQKQQNKQIAQERALNREFAAVVQ